jgi:Flp pilus assembly protein TadG
LRTSEKGSALVEFILLVLPMFGLAAATVGVTWFAFAKAQLVQISNDLAMQQAEPDTNSAELLSTAAAEVKERLGLTDFAMTNSLLNGVSSVGLEVPAQQFLGPFSLVLPPLSVVSSVPSQP